MALKISIEKTLNILKLVLMSTVHYYCYRLYWSSPYLCIFCASGWLSTLGLDPRRQLRCSTTMTPGPLPDLNGRLRKGKKSFEISWWVWTVPFYSFMSCYVALLPDLKRGPWQSKQTSTFRNRNQEQVQFKGLVEPDNRKAVKVASKKWILKQWV